MDNLVHIKTFIIYFIGINLLGFILMWLDKNYAKKKLWRISEKTFFVISILLGALGVYIGMYTFRHKTKHLKFTVLIPVLLILNISFVVYAIITNIIYL